MEEFFEIEKVLAWLSTPARVKPRERRRVTGRLSRRGRGATCQGDGKEGAAMPTARDYSLIGSEAHIGVENGLAAAAWYHSDIPRKEMKELMNQKKNKNKNPHSHRTSYQQ